MSLYCVWKDPLLKNVGINNALWICLKPEICFWLLGKVELLVLSITSMKTPHPQRTHKILGTFIFKYHYDKWRRQATFSMVQRRNGYGKDSMNKSLKSLRLNEGYPERDMNFKKLHI